jgi:hypothetical protein
LSLAMLSGSSLTYLPGSQLRRAVDLLSLEVR